MDFILSAIIGVVLVVGYIMYNLATKPLPQKDIKLSQNIKRTANTGAGEAISDIKFDMQEAEELGMVERLEHEEDQALGSGNIKTAMRKDAQEMRVETNIYGRNVKTDHELERELKQAQKEIKDLRQLYRDKVKEGNQSDASIIAREMGQWAEYIRILEQELKVKKEQEQVEKREVQDERAEFRAEMHRNNQAAEQEERKEKQLGQKDIQFEMEELRLDEKKQILAKLEKSAADHDLLIEKREAELAELEKNVETDEDKELIDLNKRVVSVINKLGQLVHSFTQTAMNQKLPAYRIRRGINELIYTNKYITNIVDLQRWVEKEENIERRKYILMQISASLYAINKTLYNKLNDILNINTNNLDVLTGAKNIGPELGKILSNVQKIKKELTHVTIEYDRTIEVINQELRK